MEEGFFSSQADALIPWMDHAEEDFVGIVVVGELKPDPEVPTFQVKPEVQGRNTGGA